MRAVRFVVRFLMGETERERAVRCSELLMEGAWIALLCWKFGFLIHDPTVLWTRPLAVLFFWGSALEAAVGVAVAALVTGWRLRLKQLSVRLSADLLGIGVTSAFVFHQLIDPKPGLPTDVPWGITDSVSDVVRHPVHLYYSLVGIAALAMVTYRSLRIKRASAVSMQPATVRPTHAVDAAGPNSQANPVPRGAGRVVYWGSGDIVRTLSVTLAVGLLAASFLDAPISAGPLSTVQLAAVLLAAFGLLSGRILQGIDRFLFAHNKGDQERSGEHV